MAYRRNGSHSVTQKWNSIICIQKDGTVAQHVKWNRSDTESTLRFLSKRSSPECKTVITKGTEKGDKDGLITAYYIHILKFMINPI